MKMGKLDEFSIEIERPGKGKFFLHLQNAGKKGFKMTVWSSIDGKEAPEEFYAENRRELIAMLNAAQDALKEHGHK